MLHTLILELESASDDEDAEIEDDNNHDHKAQSHLLTSIHNESHQRSKRQADQYEYTPTKTRCPLLLVADYRFFQEMGGGNTKTTINYLVNCNNSNISFCV